MSISLFYFANCPLPYEADPMLDTASALEYCEKLRLIITEDERFKSADKHDLSRAVSHIHLWLAKRVEFDQQPCTHTLLHGGPRALTFPGTLSDILQVTEVLNDLVKLSKVGALSWICNVPPPLLISDSLQELEGLGPYAPEFTPRYRRVCSYCKYLNLPERPIKL